MWLTAVALAAGCESSPQGMQSEAATSLNQVPDPGFETSTSGFWAQDSTSSVTRSTTSPIDGTASLAVAINGYGNHVWFMTPYTGAGSSLAVAGKVRANSASASTLSFCAAAYYADGTFVEKCATASQTVGAVGIVSATLTLDATRALAKVCILLMQEGSAGIQYSLDDVSATVTTTAATTTTPDMATATAPTTVDMATPTTISSPDLATPAPAPTPTSSPTAGYTALLTASGSSTPLPVVAGAQAPAEPGLTAPLHVSSPAASCPSMLGLINPAIAIPFDSTVREVEASYNGVALPLIDPKGTSLVEEAHSYGSMLPFWKPLFSVAGVASGAGTLQVRGYDGGHNLVSSVSIPGLQVVAPPAPVATAAVAALAHPRIYLTPARLAHALGRNTSTDPVAIRYWSSKTGVGYFLSAQNQVSDPESTAFSNLVYDPEDYIPALALCYQLRKGVDAATANKCATAAHTMAMKIANDYSSGVRSFARDDGYDIRFGLRNLMLAFDWMHDVFTPTERALIAQVGTAWVDWYTNTPGYAAGQPVENYYAGYLQGIALAALATAGENAAADRLLGLLRRKLEDEMPIVDQRACGGDWPEGWNYGPYTTLEFALVNQAMKDVGEDWSADFDFVQHTARSLTYMVTPDFSQTLSFGAYSGNLPHKSSPSLLAVLSTTTADGALAAHLYNGLNANPNNDFGDSSRGDTAYEMIFGDMTQTPSVAALPLSYLNSGSGRFFSRSSLTDTGAYTATAEDVSYLGDHFGYADGDVRLYHGATCLLCPSAYRGSPFRGEDLTSAFSTYSVNGAAEPNNSRNNQVLFATDAGTFAAVGMRFESSWAESRSDEGAADPADPLDYLIREMVHVRPGVLVVRDLHRRRHTTDTMVARWHLGSTSSVQTIAAGQYQIGTIRVGTFYPGGVPSQFSTDTDAGGHAIGTLMQQTLPSSTAQMEMVTVVSDGVTALSYSGGVLHLSNGQCVTFAAGGVTVAACP